MTCLPVVFFLNTLVFLPGLGWLTIAGLGLRIWFIIRISVSEGLLDVSVGEAISMSSATVGSSDDIVTAEDSRDGV